MRKWLGIVFVVLFSLPGCSKGTSDTASGDSPAAEPVAAGEVSKELPAGSDEAGTTAAPEPLEFPGLANAVQVGELLFGAQPTPEALEELSARGYNTVLTTRGDSELKWDEKSKVESLGMKFVSIPMPYPIENITDEEVDRFAELMDKGEGPMVLHCGSGNRVAGLWTVWLVERQGVDPEQALELGTKAGMTRIRPVVEKRLAMDRE